MSAPHLPRPAHAAAARPRPRALLAAGMLVLAVALGGCGIRLETPPPVEPSPDAVEQVRGRTVEDALALAADAQDVLDAGAAEPVAAVLADVVASGQQHAEQLGGVYDSGLPEPTPSATPTGTAASGEPATVESVLAELASDAGTALDDADAVADGSLARLVGSVATARGELAARLAAALGVPAPEVVVTEATTPTADGTPQEDVSGAPDATDADATASDGGAPADAPGDAGVPTAAPDGLTRTDLDALTLAHDEAGYALEVVAAALAGDQRTLAWESAAEHRREADRWAQASGAAGTLADPRRTAYALPAGLDDPAVATGLVRTVETGLADTYANVAAAAPAGSRGDLLDGLRAATARARTWGATPVAFPGMPELTAAPQPAATAG